MAQTLHRTDTRNGAPSVYSLFYPFVSEMTVVDAIALRKQHTNAFTRSILEGVEKRDELMTDDKSLTEVNAQIDKAQKAIDKVISEKAQAIAEALGLSLETAKRTIQEARGGEIAPLLDARKAKSGKHLKAATYHALDEYMGKAIDRILLKDVVIIAFHNKAQSWPETAFVYGQEKNVVEYILKASGGDFEEVDSSLRGLKVNSVAQCHQVHYALNSPEEGVKAVKYFWGNSEGKTVSYKTGVSAPSVTRSEKRSSFMADGVNLFPDD